MTAVAREQELIAEIERLRAEVSRLQEELSGRQTRRARQMAGANAARIARSATTDDLVFAAFLRELKKCWNCGASDVDLRLSDYPRFLAGHLRRAVAASLNAEGIPAPRGGPWSTKQVSRALERRSMRASSSLE